MKAQMRFQKILALVSLIIAAISIVYALIFCSGIMNQIGAILEFDDPFYENRTTGRASGAVDLFNASQSFSDMFLVLGVVLILAVVLLYIFACNSRRKYYITNYIAIGIVVVYEIVYAVLLLANTYGMQVVFSCVNLEACQYYYENVALNSYGAWNPSTWMMTLGYVLSVIVLLDAVAIVLNLIWKIKLMKGEKALLENGLAKEVA